MKTMLKPFMKKLFGIKYERLTQTLLVDLILFQGLRAAGFRVEIAPSILYLTVSAFTGGVMWQALSSKDNTDDLRHMLMLPFERHKLVFSYTAALGLYTFLTKTALLLAVLLAVSDQNLTKVFGSIFCGFHAIMTAAALFSLRKHRYAASLWVIALTAALIWSESRPWFLPIIVVSYMWALFILLRADGYSFDPQKKTGTRAGKFFRVTGIFLHATETPRCHCRHSMWKYLFRYLYDHKNYLVNTVIMWGIACALPLFFRQTESLAVIPVGFAILSLNTPICILLSCDPALEQAVRFLPGQGMAFCLPYCAFIFLCNLTADSLFLISWQFQAGGITGWMAAAALFFALLSAVCSVLLEWFFPVRNWKIESDLWHHPRKYVVPTAMLLLAGVVSIMFF